MNSKNKNKIFKRLFSAPKNKSFFLFGPRGTGKTTWLRMNFPDALYLDLLEAEIYNNLLARPERLESFIPPNFNGWIILDEVQRVPALLNEVHRLIEKYKFKFILTGSSARKLKSQRSYSHKKNGVLDSVNLLAGRALTYRFYPLTYQELGRDFDLGKSLQYGNLPSVFFENDPKKYLESYVMTYLEQEVQFERLTRNVGNFSRFLEVASLSQGGILNISEVARDCAVHRKVVENYFQIIDDLLIATRLPAFTKKAKRRMVAHNKFYYFDVGIYRAIRPTGPLDKPEFIEGAGMETLVFQELRAVNDYLGMGYKLYFWHTATNLEVDFVLYGPRGIIAVEVKRANKFSNSDLRGLRAFVKDYQMARSYFLYNGKRVMYEGGIKIMPIELFFEELPKILK